MLNAATESIGLYDEVELNECSTDGLSSDPENCSGFYSCHNGKRIHSFYNSFLRKFFANFQISLTIILFIFSYGHRSAISRSVRTRKILRFH